MRTAWLEISRGAEKRRYDLNLERTRIGGPGCDVEVPEPAGDELHLWSDPPRVVQVGRGTTPLMNGRAFEETALSTGDSIQWGGAVLVYQAPAVLEELPPMDGASKLSASCAPAGHANPGELRAWRRLQAGMAIELGLANRKISRRWQEAVLRGEYDPDAVAREVLADPSAPEASDPRLLERAGRLERDLLMAPVQRGVRGASRRMRRKAKGGAAFLVANLVAIMIYSLVLAMILILLRRRNGISVDGWIDRILGAFG